MFPRPTATKPIFAHGRGFATMIATRREDLCGRTGSVDATGRGAVHWLGLAAAPTFAIMALLTGCSRRRRAGCALLGGARCVTAERNGPDVPADDCLPFGAVAEADLRPAQRCPRSLIRASGLWRWARIMSCLRERRAWLRGCVRGACADWVADFIDTRKTAGTAARSIAGQEPEFMSCWIGLPLCSGHRSNPMTLTGSNQEELT